jgi:hypothetical protein
MGEYKHLQDNDEIHFIIVYHGAASEWTAQVTTRGFRNNYFFPTVYTGLHRFLSESGRKETTITLLT